MSHNGLQGGNEHNLDESPNHIKQEEKKYADFGGVWPFDSDQTIDLLSDNESDNEMAPAERPAPQPASNGQPQPRSKASNGNSKDADGMKLPSPENSAHAQPIDRQSGNGQDGEKKLDNAAMSAKLLARQKLMANRFRVEQPAKRAPTPTKAQTDDDDDTPMHEAAPPDNDNDVHGLPDNHGEHIDAKAAEFARIKEKYEKKKDAQLTSFQEDIEFMKLASAESSRRTKLELDRLADLEEQGLVDDDEESGLFIPEQENDVPSFNALNSDNEDEDKSAAKKKKRGRPKKTADDDDGPNDNGLKRKKARTIPTNAGRQSKAKGRKAAEDAQFAAVLKEIQAAQGKGVSKAKGKGKLKGKGKEKKQNGPVGPVGPVMTNFASTFGADVFADTAKTAHLASQPMVEKTARRDHAMKKMLASVPTENKKIAKMDKEYLNEAIRAITGQQSVKPADDGNWSVNGMKTTLKHYQILGVGFMRGREDDDDEPRGGILADEMGLGKTLMMLTNIVNGLPKRGKMPRATLVVASPALVTQWSNEVLRHCHTGVKGKEPGIRRFMRYTARERLSSNQDEEIFSSCDIILTTYHEVSRSFPKCSPPAHLVTAEQKDIWWRNEYNQQRGVLHKVKFLRVVLDEAQAIKNHKGHTSLACRAINAQHHWAITGTPIMNSIKEFYPYFKFLHEPNTGSYKIFKENFCSPDDPDGIDKLNIFLRKFMIRRTHIDTLFNARLLDLPQPKEHTVWLEFNDVERQIYEIVKQRFVQRINSIAKAGELQSSYGNIWNMITRLRQICSHVLIAQHTITDLLEREDLERLSSIIPEDEDTDTDEGSTILYHLREVLKNKKGAKTVETGAYVGGADLAESEAIPTEILDVDQTSGQVGQSHGKAFKFGKYLDDFMKSEQWDTAVQATECRGCKQRPDRPHVTSCFHIYCLACLKELQAGAARHGRDGARCLECGTQYTDAKPCKGIETFETLQSSSIADSTSADGKRSKPKNNPHSWIDLAGQILPSAKSRAVKAQILNWLDEEPSCKIIIYSQFIPMLKILEKICRSEDWSFCTYNGGMSHDSRERSIDKFRDTDTKIMLASLKCGGLGLNLTMASRVICLDPWWNAAVEQQAFCRVFRIGQQKETRMTRFVIKNTIDAAMMQVKERKLFEIDAVMDDTKKKEKIDVTELIRLFGSVGEDGDGKPFIFAEGEDRFDPDDPMGRRLAEMDEEDEHYPMGNEQ